MKAFSGAATLALFSAWPAHAQPSTETTNAGLTDDTTEQTAASRSAPGRQVYTPVDFTRFAPRNALDMLSQIPGFGIRESEQLRGIGQATGNVIFNGQRSSNKSDSLFTLLQRIPASNVTQIEIVDGSSLDIPGLSGQVANIVYEANILSGQFSWKPEFRARYADPLFTRGDISLSGRSGAIEYELGLNNDQSGRSAAGGPTLIFDRTNAVIETRNEVFRSNYDSPKLSGKVTWDGPGSSVGHANAHYQRIYNRFNENGFRVSPDISDRSRIVRQKNDTWNYEIGADYELAAGPGRLKAIGLRRFSHEPFTQTIITSFADCPSSEHLALMAA